jgi:hypothetical protein
LVAKEFLTDWDFLYEDPNRFFYATTIIPAFNSSAKGLPHTSPNVRLRTSLNRIGQVLGFTHSPRDEISMEKFSRYQQSVIKNYYRNREGIAVQRVQELVTELYLAEGKKRIKVWEQLRPHLQSIGLTEKQIEHLEKEDRPEMVAKLITDKI